MILIPGPSKGCQMDGNFVPLSNPLGFKHHPLEGAGSLSKEIPWQIPSGNSDLGISGVRVFL